MPVYTFTPDDVEPLLEGLAILGTGRKSARGKVIGQEERVLEGKQIPRARNSEILLA